MGRKWPQVPKSVPINHNSRRSKSGICRLPQGRKIKSLKHDIRWFYRWHCAIFTSFILFQQNLYPYGLSSRADWRWGQPYPGSWHHTQRYRTHTRPHTEHTCAHTHIHGVKLWGEESTCLCSSAFYTLFSCTRSTFSLSHSVPTCFPFCSPHFSPLSPTFNLPFTSSFFSYSSTPPPTLCRLRCVLTQFCRCGAFMEPGVFSVTCYVKNDTVTILEFYLICKHEGQVRHRSTGWTHRV